MKAIPVKLRRGIGALRKAARARAAVGVLEDAIRKLEAIRAAGDQTLRSLDATSRRVTR